MRVSLWVAILVVASVGARAAAQSADLSQDPLLQKRITVWLKMEPLRDALRTVGKQTGVARRCQDAITQEEMAIFVYDEGRLKLRFATATVQGYEILFLTPTGERKFYVFYLRSVEPSRLLERAPKSSQGGEAR